MKLNTIFNLKQIEELLDAKQRFGQLLFFSLPGMYCVFRALTVAETEALLSLSDQLNETAIEDWVVSKTLIISNKSLDHILNKAGYLYVTNFAQKVMLLSNIKEEKEYKKAVMKARGSITTIQGNVESLIAKGYQSLDPYSIKNMTQLKQMDLLAMAEQITGVSLNLGKQDRPASKHLRKFSSDAVVLGGTAEDITSKEAADIPDFNERFE